MYCVPTSAKTALCPQSERSSVEEEGDERIEEEEDDSDGEATTNADGYTTTEAGPDKPPTIRERISGCFTSCCDCLKCKKDEAETKPSLTVEVDTEKGTTVSEVSGSTFNETCKNEMMDIWTWFRAHTKSFIYCVWFENGIMLCIIINTMCLAIDSPGLSLEVKAVLTKINDVRLEFQFIFAN